MASTVVALREDRPRATLIEVGQRKISPKGWALDLVEEHLDGHIGQLSNQWCRVDCLARTMFGRNTPANRARVRKNMPRAFRDMVRRNRFLVIEYAPAGGGTHGEALACKIHDRTQGDAAELQATEYQLAKMLRRRQISDSLLETARALLA